MPGMLTIDADEVRAVANGLVRIELQLKDDTEQVTWQLSSLEAALQYTDVGVSAQIRQAITQMNAVTQLLQTAQTRLLQVVTDTLHLESDIDAGSGRGSSGSGPGSDNGGEGDKGPTYGGVAPMARGDTADGEEGRVSTMGVGWGGSLVTLPISEYKSGDFQNSVDAHFGTAGVGAGFMEKDGNIYAGVWGQATAASISDEGSYGTNNLAVTYGAGAQALSATEFAGVYDDSLGFDAGLNLVSVNGSVGTNIAGVHVGVNAGIGLSLNFGVEVGKHTQIKLGPFTLGFDLSW